jgi:hypothetical protein
MAPGYFLLRTLLINAYAAVLLYWAWRELL